MYMSSAVGMMLLLSPCTVALAPSRAAVFARASQHDGNLCGSDPRSWLQRRRWRWLPRGPPPSGLLPESGTIAELTTAEQLVETMRHTPHDRFICLRFTRVGCVPCTKTSEAFAQAAVDYGGVGLFYNVQFEDSKPFVKACGVKAAPVAQIYAQGVSALLSLRCAPSPAFDARRPCSLAARPCPSRSLHTRKRPGPERRGLRSRPASNRCRRKWRLIDPS